ncbi:MAG: hypothetical protein K2G32_02710 [Oscillospiraceae bacterium]|nr:hypothetical protein [Oscillospiraceae bacterium]
MMIMSKDGKMIIKVNSVQVVKNIGGPKGEKYVLSANGGFGSGGVLGLYADEKTAVDELEKIYAAISEGAKIYRINS